MKTLVAAAAELGIKLDAAMIDDWSIALSSKSDEAAAEIVDAVMDRLVPQLRSDLFDELRKRGMTPPNQTVINKVREAFERGEPYPNRVELGETVSAGWLRLRELDVAPCRGESEEDQHRERINSYKVLADLVLKTVEIAEYYDRIDGHAER